uniref:Uncharacterized protein n=2 Tax=Acrobeloides nanus TaxID=290746 RepID=A0A914EQE2_9BILA
MDSLMESFLCCCTSCKPRYKRLVDAIYPRSLTDGLVNANMQKLTFYSISHPEKLNRIGQYLVLRLSRDLYRTRFIQVKIAVDAMDQLLKSCHGSPSLNQFTESYLKMVQKLLETNEPKMEKLATDLFVGFSSIEEDIPSYHRQYDFFISKFTSMCHASTGEQAKSRRYDGLRGLRGVIWKSVTDDLQANIWEKQHMDKIVPSILFNFQDEPEDFDENVDQSSSMLYHSYPFDNGPNEDPHALALQCLRELMGKASFGSLRSVLEPVMKHCDLHKKWEPPAIFAINTFKAILYSIQTQNSYFVIQELINHLDNMSNFEASTRIGIATVLSSIVSIAGTSIGPLLLGIFNSLLKRLRASVEFQQSKQCPSISDEKTFQDTLINAMGDFANALPDYQKVEIMMFTIGNIPMISEDEKHLKTSDAFLQKVLVKTLLKVATKYKTFYLATIFTDSFLKPLLLLMLAPNSEVRLISQKIFHTLLDRHDNLQKLEHLPYVSDVIDDLRLSVEKCSRQDQLFMRRHINNITSVLYRSVCIASENEDLIEHLDATLCSMSLLCVEVGHDETLIELFRLAFALQLLALGEEYDFSYKKRLEIHNLVAKYLNLSCQLLAIPALVRHVEQVIINRSQSNFKRLNILKPVQLSDPLLNTKKDVGKAPIASMESEDDFTPRIPELDDKLLFNREIFEKGLDNSKKDIEPLKKEFEAVFPTSVSENVLSKNEANKKSRDRKSLVIFTADGNDDVDDIGNPPDTTGLGEENTFSIDSSSIDWSPPESHLVSRRSTLFGAKLALPLTIETLRTIVHTPIDPNEEERKDREMSLEIVTKYRERPLDEITAELAKELEDHDLSKTIQRLTKKNNEWNKLQ